MPFLYQSFHLSCPLFPIPCKLHHPLFLFLSPSLFLFSPTVHAFTSQFLSLFLQLMSLFVSEQQGVSTSKRLNPKMALELEDHIASFIIKCEDKCFRRSKRLHQGQTVLVLNKERFSFPSLIWMLLRHAKIISLSLMVIHCQRGEKY